MPEVKTNQPIETNEAVTPPRWTGSPSIALAQELNVQCVDILFGLAIDLSYQQVPPFVLQNRDLWRLLDEDARRRLAAFPFVLVDLRFKDADWWRKVATSNTATSIDSTPFGDLAIETLLFARQTAREDVVVAKAMFAMASPVTSLVASLTLPQVRAIALGNTSQLRVLWDNDPQFWGDLLVACRAGDERALSTLRRHGKLLFCGEFIGQ